ncbi:MAG: hypothetical protein U1E10_04400 [Bdellovibrionales bacterium]|nr:hypothetical protein [Bdellovibrionales bacterium]
MPIATHAVRNTVQFIIALAFLSLALLGCQPKDEKVSTRGANPRPGESNQQIDSDFDDRGLEYTRSMLIELADVSRQVESVLAKAAEKTPAAIPPAASPEVLPLKMAACRTIRDFESPEGTLEFLMEAKDCKEKGPTFEGTQFGRELAFASFILRDGKPVVTAMKVQGKGLETSLRPLVNPKDSLRAKAFRFLDVKLVGEENGERLYRFWFESESTYALNLKAFLDDGLVKSRQSGVLVVDVLSGKVKAYRAVEKTDRFDLTVESGRKGRSGSGIVRQEFRASGVVDLLDVNLAECGLPQGAVESRFTVRKIDTRPGAERKYLIDSSEKFQTDGNSIVNPRKKEAEPGAKVSAALCSADEWITTTEFFSGLVY